MTALAEVLEMKTGLCFFLIVLLLATPVNFASGQTPSPPESQEEIIDVRSNEVLLDAVVRDKQGHAVKDLSASDFEIYEDGVRQEVSSFRLVTRSVRLVSTGAIVNESSGAPATNSAPKESGAEAKRSGSRALDSDVSTGAIALVFDRLSPDARARARIAALGYVTNNSATDDIFGVFSIDQSLRVLQPFTADLPLVRQAVERGGSEAPAQFGSTAAQVRSINDNTESLERSAVALQATAAATGQGDEAQNRSATNALAANIVQQQFNEMTARTLATFEALERDQQGYATTNGLLSLVDGLRRLPGRKAIIFFSEGLAIPPAVEARFRSVISNANRSNVSIYTVDAAGLRVDSVNQEVVREIAAIANARVRQQATGRDDRSGRPMSRTLERNEDLLRSAPESGLGQLAAETGGFFVNNTNDIAKRLRLVDEDLHTYYELSYTPKNAVYDGRFRRLSVKLKRSNLEVRSRQGYYAIGGAFASPVLAYEAPALGAAGRMPTPNAFPMFVRALNFPEAARPGLTSVIIEVPVAAATLTPDKNKISQSDFSVVVLIRNEARQVVKKMSQQYLLNVAAQDRAALKTQNIQFYREDELPPGRYTVEAIAYDAPSGGASVRRSSFEVPESDETKLRLSSVVIIKRVEPSATSAEKQRPLQFEGTLIHPNLGETLRRSNDKQLAFFVTVYGTKEGSEPPKMTLEIARGGRTTGRASATLSAPDKSNRIQYASALPTDKMQPGEYELKIIVENGSSKAMRSVGFTVEP